jgi:DUF2934 family protein
VPRTNSPQSTTTNRTRSRGPARSTTDSPAQPNTLDAASDMSSSSAASTAGASYDPSYDEIAEAAYQRYLQRGGADGRDFDDWLEAERELKSRGRAS